MASDPGLHHAQSRPPAPLLSVRGLTIRFGDRPPVVAGVDLDLLPGRLCALVGETGAGKSLVAMAMAGLLPPGSTFSATRLRLGETEMTRLDEGAWSRIRGRRVGVVLQDPFTALDPLMRVGGHLSEAIRAHAAVDRTELRRRTVSALERVGLGEAERLVHAFPGELSGGMRQRVQIALALLHDPVVLIADEPTASLDAEARDGILDLIVGLCRERGTSALLISHDLQSIRSRADDVVVMVQGRIVETGPAGAIFDNPCNPFTAAVLAAGDPTRRPAPSTRIRRHPAPPGCSYYQRCPVAVPICAQVVPLLGPSSAGRSVACHVSKGGAS